MDGPKEVKEAITEILAVYKRLTFVVDFTLADKASKCQIGGIEEKRKFYDSTNVAQNYRPIDYTYKNRLHCC